MINATILSLSMNRTLTAVSPKITPSILSPELTLITKSIAIPKYYSSKKQTASIKLGQKIHQILRQYFATPNPHQMVHLIPHQMMIIQLNP